MQSARKSNLTYVKDRELGHHGNFVRLSVSCIKVPGFGVLGLETGLPKAFEVNGIYSHQSSHSWIKHICIDKTGNMA